MRGDGKNKFYRNLNLDHDTRKIMKWYRDLFQEMVNESKSNKPTKKKKSKDV